MGPIKRKQYTLKEKNEALELVNKGSKRSVIQAQFGISSSTLTDWVKAKSTIAAKFISGKGNVKRLTPCQSIDLYLVRTHLTQIYPFDLLIVRNQRRKKHLIPGTKREKMI